MPILLDQRVERDILAPMSPPVTLSSSDAQRAWASRPVTERLRVIKKARHLLAAQTDALCAAIPAELARNAADTMCAEIIPLLEAFKFLEREAERILAPRSLGKQGRPLWLIGVTSEVQRVPIGRVLLIAPSNYPLFLAGVQVAQALVAGNSAVWKPGTGGKQVALLVAETMRSAGLPNGLLEVTEDTVEAAHRTIASGVDKLFFTGSFTSGKALLRELAETVTPCVAELSGCDAVFVLPSADLTRVVKALTFGMRLNGSATCMAPRRIICVGASPERRSELIASLSKALSLVPGIMQPPRVKQQTVALIEESARYGATLHGSLDDEQQPLLVTNVTPQMQISQADIFAPILTLLDASGFDHALKVNEACPYALTAAVFGDERDALALAARILAGTVIVNDLMVPAADPRTPFGGRRSSGFGTTQGAEGLLEMTAPKTIAVRRGSSTNHYDRTTALHERLFRGIIRASHRSSWRERLSGLKEMLAAAKKLNSKN